MPMPLWWGQINKRVFNPMELRRGERPILQHVGRTTGRGYRTPLDAHAVDGGFVFILVYGSGSDWVRNVLHAGGGELRIDGTTHQLGNPRLITAEEAWRLIGPTVKRPPAFLKISEYLRADAALQ